VTGKYILTTLTKNIAEGRFSDDGKLPSEAALCKHFGVSRMTVRGALEELRRHGLIEKRNGAGSFLTHRALRKSGLIGLVIPNYDDFEFFADIRNEINRHCSRIGYRLELACTHEREPEAAIRDIRRKVRELAVARAEGIIFRPYVSEKFSNANREIVRICRHAEIPVLLIDADITRPPERSDCDLVAVNNIDAGRRIADYLYGRGARRIAFLAQGKQNDINANWKNRLFGLAGELALLGCEQSVRTLRFAATDQKALSAALRGRQRPDAIVCGNDEMAAALVKNLHQLGKQVPEDIAVIGFDDLPLASTTSPPLTTVSQPIRKIAATAIKVLLARIRYPNNDPREIYLVAPLVARSSA